jgi:MFS transporter, DHA1 family, tetracycline resistance protein
MTESIPLNQSNNKLVPKSTFWILFFIVFIDLVGFGIVFPILPEVTRQYNLSEFQTGLILGSYSLMQFLFCPVLGQWSDRIGRRPVLILSMAGTALSFFLMGFAGKIGSFFEVFLFARALDGLAGSSMSTAQAYMADVSPKEHRTRNMGMWIGAAFGLGFALGPVIGALFQWIGEWAAPGFGPGFAFVLAGVLVTINTLFALFKLPESLTKRDSEHKVGQRTSSVFLIASTVIKPAIGPLMLSYALTIFAFAFMEATVTWLTIDVYKLPHIGIYLLFAYFGFVICYGQGKLVRKLAEKWGDKKLAIVGCAMLGGGLILMPWNWFAATPWLSYAYLAITAGVMCLGESLCQPSLISSISKRADDAVQGETMGVTQSLASLARFTGPLLATSIYALGTGWPYLISAALMLIAIGIIAWAFQQSESSSTTFPMTA